MTNLHRKQSYKNENIINSFSPYNRRFSTELYYKEKIELGAASRKFRDEFPNNTVYTLMYKENGFQRVRVFYNIKKVFKILRCFYPDFKFTKKDIICLNQGRVIKIKNKDFPLNFMLTKNILE